MLILIETWIVAVGIKRMAGQTFPQYTNCADHRVQGRKSVQHRPQFRNILSSIRNKLRTLKGILLVAMTCDKVEVTSWRSDRHLSASDTWQHARSVQSRLGKDTQQKRKCKLVWTATANNDAPNNKCM
jgi:hypothetical protein